MTDQISLINGFAKCPSCGTQGRFAAARAGRVACGGCDENFAFDGGILDFVAGRQRTKLDDIDYDELYSVDRQLLDQFRFFKARTDPLFDAHYDRVLEIGAGTGGLTVAMLLEADIGAACVTDISTDMLAQCRGKVQHHKIQTPVLYATNNGEELNARDESFDLIVAYFCVHHILDYERFLASCYRALRPGGKAVFAEPGLRFLRALHDCSLPAIGRLARDSSNWGDPDFGAVLNVHRNMHFTTKYAGDMSVVGELEDKHAFGRYEFEFSARKAGFEMATTLPYGVADDPLSALSVYAAQMGASAEFMNRYIEEVRLELPGPFRLLDPTEAAPSLVFVLEKAASPDASKRVDGELIVAEAFAAPAVAPDDIAIRYDMRIEMPNWRSGSAFRVDGWALSRRPVKGVRFASCTASLELPVGSVSRPDVYAGYVGNHVYSPATLLHCGFSAERPAATAPFKKGDSVNVSIVLDNGQICEIERGIELGDKPTCFHAV